MFKAYASFWKHYIDFKGRTKRSEFWWPFLFNNLIRLAFYLIVFIDLLLPYSQELKLMKDSALPTDNFTIWSHISPIMVVIIIIWILFELAILLPSLAIGVRRFRDAAFHWSFIFMYGVAVFLSALPLPGLFQVLALVLAAGLTIASIVLWIFPSREKKPKVPKAAMPQFVAPQAPVVFQAPSNPVASQAGPGQSFNPQAQGVPAQPLNPQSQGAPFMAQGQGQFPNQGQAPAPQNQYPNVARPGQVANGAGQNPQGSPVNPAGPVAPQGTPAKSNQQANPFNQPQQ